MNKPPVFILWDASGIWGLMAFRALRHLQINCCLVSGKDIAQGAIRGKQGKNGLLLAPGGNARQKFLALGKDGQKSLLNWLHDGGSYLGFCGGAGLALKDAYGLGICKLQRESYPSRFFHLLSGHVLAKTKDGPMNLPVWWPGRFSPATDPDTEVLACYDKPAPDLYIADIPFNIIPENMTLSLEGHAPSEKIFPAGQPLAVAGKYGNGRFILSYAHLETPDSPAANKWLATLLAGYGPAQENAVPAWNTVNTLNRTFTRENFQSDFVKEMRKASARLRAFLALGQQLDFFFPRSGWLMGWRPGFPGMGLNNLAACLDALSSLPDKTSMPENCQLAVENFNKLMPKFFQEAEDCLWHLKLENAMAHLPEKMSVELPDTRIWDIFGKAMPGGGLVEDITRICSSLIYELQESLYRL